MCRLALLNRQAVLRLGLPGLTYLFECLEQALGGDGNGVAGWWEQQGTVIQKGVRFSATEAADCAQQYIEQGARWVLFHTRRATSSAVLDRYCHPFQMGQLVLAHNGHDLPFARLGRMVGMSDSECIARTWSRVRFPLSELAARSGVFMGFRKHHPFVIKGQQHSDLVAAWDEASGAMLFASQLPLLLQGGFFEYIVSLATIEWFGRDLALETLHTRPEKGVHARVWSVFDWREELQVRASRTRDMEEQECREDREAGEEMNLEDQEGCEDENLEFLEDQEADEDQERAAFEAWSSQRPSGIGHAKKGPL